MKLQLLIALFLGLFATAATAQIFKPTEGFKDHIVFKNGSNIYGKILFYIPNDTIEFQDVDNRIMRFSAKLIKKVEMAKPDNGVIAPVKAEKTYSFKEKGFYGSVAYDMSFGRNKFGNGTHTGVGLQATAGHLFRREFGVGGGIAYDSYYLKGGNANVLAAFTEIRGYLSKRQMAEFFTLAIGYGHPMKQDNILNVTSERKGGFMLQPTLGLRLGASARYNFFLEVGARFQQVHFNFSTEWVENRYTVTYQRWILRGGIVF